MHAFKLKPEPGRVLIKAVLRAAEQLQLRHKELGKVLGVSPSTVARLEERDSLSEAAAERGLLFVRVYRSLLGIVGSDEAAVAWLRGHNRYLAAAPREAIQKVEGLVMTLQYLDAMRGKI